MRNSILVAAFAGLGLTACEKATDKAVSSKDTLIAVDRNASSIQECYAFVQQKDTIALEIDQDGAKVSGNLHFKNYEKDSSHGPVEGEYAGDTLKLEYTFQSEGMTSVREVRFLKSGNSLLMGIGDMDDKDGKLSFTKDVKYDKTLVLVKTNCQP